MTAYGKKKKPMAYDFVRKGSAGKDMLNNKAETTCPRDKVAGILPRLGRYLR